MKVNWEPLSENREQFSYKLYLKRSMVLESGGTNIYRSSFKIH